jgi:hypothetical protein
MRPHLQMLFSLFVLLSHSICTSALPLGSPPREDAAFVFHHPDHPNYNHQYEGYALQDSTMDGTAAYTDYSYLPQYPPQNEQYLPPHQYRPHQYVNDFASLMQGHDPYAASSATPALFQDAVHSDSSWRGDLSIQETDTANKALKGKRGRPPVYSPAVLEFGNQFLTWKGTLYSNDHTRKVSLYKFLKRLTEAQKTIIEGGNAETIHTLACELLAGKNRATNWTADLQAGDEEILNEVVARIQAEDSTVSKYNRKLLMKLGSSKHDIAQMARSGRFDDDVKEAKSLVCSKRKKGNSATSNV